MCFNLYLHRVIGALLLIKGVIIPEYNTWVPRKKSIMFFFFLTLTLLIGNRNKPFLSKSSIYKCRCNIVSYANILLARHPSIFPPQQTADVRWGVKITSQKNIWVGAWSNKASLFKTFFVENSTAQFRRPFLHPSYEPVWWPDRWWIPFICPATSLSLLRRDKS